MSNLEFTQYPALARTRACRDLLESIRSAVLQGRDFKIIRELQQSWVKAAYQGNAKHDQRLWDKFIDGLAEHGILLSIRENFNSVGPNDLIIYQNKYF